MKHSDVKKTVTVAITGASGSIYGLKLIETLLKSGRPVFLMISNAGKVVLESEEGLKLPDPPDAQAAVLTERFSAGKEQLSVFSDQDWFAPVASGSGAPRRMVVCPCTMGNLSAIAAGASDNLIERSADVVLKEQGRLILVPREMPLSCIHLENMLKLARMGVIIMPASPSFYNKPRTVSDMVNSVVARVLDHLEVEHQLHSPWGCDKGFHSQC